MKILNKVISSVCAIAMLSTMAVSMVHAADPQPKLVASVEYTDETKTAGTISFSLDGATGNEEITYAQAYLTIPSDEFVITGYYNTNTNMGKKVLVPDVQVIDDVEYEISATLTKAKHGAVGTDILPIAISEMMGILDGNEVAFPVKGTIFTVDFALADGVKSGTMTLTNTKVGGDGWFYGTSDTADATKELKVDAITVGTTVEPPTPEKPTVKDDGTILPIKPSDIGGTGDVFVGEDGSKAVAGLGNFTSTGTVNGIEWTIKYTPVGGEEVTKSKTFTPEWLAGATLETKMTIGLIVNYSPAEYDNVTIVSGALN